MLSRTAARLSATRLDTHKLFKDINQNPMKNWKAAFSEKLSPQPGQAEAIHKHRVHEEGPEYGQLTANNFPYPLMYATMFFLFAWFCITDYGDVHANYHTEWPGKTWAPKNSDGTTVVRSAPATPNPLFNSMVQVNK
eukprot:TRINITY_DN2366_c1_g2_i1.p2 TRINITY_DN2366_c1_g2~~TRINITY_DN2366_c1_g2_i1.p2  ORF type:complete len:137 (+),score=36.94 TRINITY_DN2366_c1_g2_i1:59-469(+)